MIVRQHFIPGIAHSSYLVAGEKACVVIDPSRDVDRYIEEARGMGVSITHIFETHLHADFISGHLDLARATGAEIVAPKAANCTYPHTPVAEGDEAEIEHIRFRVIETAGHTPDHCCYVATDTSRGETPVALFSGDTLFVGDVGRPDLFPGRAEELATRLFENLHNKILALPDECEVYPAHGKGSLCGPAMTAKRSSTIGYERKYNYALQIHDRDAFIRALTSGLPAAPDHFTRCSAINQRGPELMQNLGEPVPVGPEQFFKRMNKKDTVVLDVRGYPCFSGVHCTGAWNIDLAGNFATQAGWVLPPNRDILIIVENERDVPEATLQLRRVGFDRVVGFLKGGMIAWAMRGLPVTRVPVLPPEEADAQFSAGKAILIDVRSEEEWKAAPVEHAVHIPWHDLRTRHKELDPKKHYILMCRGGSRASIAVSILQMQDFSRVSNLAGGFEAYRRAGFVR
ncbi:MAG: MBL fold metallo-hydrolase [Methanomicrobiales archaeon]|nr:MBL fold metallo-hydrolase [Methanomicrobiales archaeon]